MDKVLQPGIKAPKSLEGLMFLREESIKEVHFNKHLCSLSPDGFGLSAQLAILKRSLRENFDLVIANWRDRVKI